MFFIIFSYIIFSLYRAVLRPFLQGGCRFWPSCSGYCLEAVQHHGWIKGLALSVARLARCHPWGSWGYDPVPFNTDKSSEKALCKIKKIF